MSETRAPHPELEAEPASPQEYFVQYYTDGQPSMGVWHIEGNADKPGNLLPFDSPKLSEDLKVLVTTADDKMYFVTDGAVCVSSPEGEERAIPVPRESLLPVQPGYMWNIDGHHNTRSVVKAVEAVGQRSRSVDGWVRAEHRDERSTIAVMEEHFKTVGLLPAAEQAAQESADPAAQQAGDQAPDATPRPAHAKSKPKAEAAPKPKPSKTSIETPEATPSLTPGDEELAKDMSLVNDPEELAGALADAEQAGDEAGQALIKRAMELSRQAADTKHNTVSDARAAVDKALNESTEKPKPKAKAKHAHAAKPATKKPAAARKADDEPLGPDEEYVWVGGKTIPGTDEAVGQQRVKRKKPAARTPDTKDTPDDYKERLLKGGVNVEYNPDSLGYRRVGKEWSEEGSIVPLQALSDKPVLIKTKDGGHLFAPRGDMGDVVDLIKSARQDKLVTVARDDGDFYEPFVVGQPWKQGSYETGEIDSVVVSDGYVDADDSYSGEPRGESQFEAAHDIVMHYDGTTAQNLADIEARSKKLFKNLPLVQYEKDGYVHTMIEAGVPGDHVDWNMESKLTDLSSLVEGHGRQIIFTAQNGEKYYVAGDVMTTPDGRAVRVDLGKPKPALLGQEDYELPDGTKINLEKIEIAYSTFKATAKNKQAFLDAIPEGVDTNPFEDAEAARKEVIEALGDAMPAPTRQWTRENVGDRPAIPRPLEEMLAEAEREAKEARREKFQKARKLGGAAIKGTFRGIVKTGKQVEKVTGRAAEFFRTTDPVELATAGLAKIIQSDKRLRRISRGARSKKKSGAKLPNSPARLSNEPVLTPEERAAHIARKKERQDRGEIA